MEDLPCNIDAFCADEATFLTSLKEARNWRRVPLLNHTPLHLLPDHALVRFRGMVQDMCDPEIYLEKYEVRNHLSGEIKVQNGKYRDCLAIGPNEETNAMSQHSVHADRRTIFVITIPGLNDWACSQEKIANQSAKGILLDSSTANGCGQKRALADDVESMEVDNIEKNTTKRICSEQQSSKCELTNQSLLSAEYLLNSPLKDRPSKACMVKLYKDFDKYALNSALEFVGFLSVDPILDGSTHQVDEFEDMAEVHAANPPPSLIPRLHAIAVKELDHLNPLLDESLLPVQESLESIGAIQKDLISILTQCLFGDGIAAEFMLSNLLSNVFVRTDMQTLGQFSLNICGIPKSCLPSYTTELYDIIQSLMPASHYFPMTLDNMNTQQFVPKKDYKTNKLVSGLLQLAPQTHLILDETRLEPGKLEENGVRGVQSLADLIKTQQIKANFHFFDMNYDMNVPVLTLSEGKSMLPCDVQISLKPDADCIPLIHETLTAAKHYLQSKLDTIRRYLTSSKLLSLHIDNEIMTLIGDYFVDIRKKDSTFGPEQLNSLLLLARLLATARGKTTLDQDVWELAKNLQSEQRERINQLPKRK